MTSPGRTPRIGPLTAAEDEVTFSELQAQFGPDVPNIFATLARHPALLESWWQYGRFLLADGVLPRRIRHLVILRTSSRAGSEYEWAQHEPRSERRGVLGAEIGQIIAGPEAGWDEFESAVLRAVDQFLDRSSIDDLTWAVLAESLDHMQLIELCMLIGQYHMVAFMLRSLQVAVER
jgi:4-carboxymuconolactone decarboxylase